MGFAKLQCFSKCEKGKTGVITTINKQKQNYVKYKEADSGDNVKWPNSSNNIIGATIKVDQEFDGDKLATLYFEHSFKDGGKPYYAPGLGGWNTIEPGASGTDLNNNISGKFEWGRGEKILGLYKYIEIIIVAIFMIIIVTAIIMKLKMV